jgi:hypothetical protein
MHRLEALVEQKREEVSHGGEGKGKEGENIYFGQVR